MLSTHIRIWNLCKKEVQCNNNNSSTKPVQVSCIQNMENIRSYMLSYGNLIVDLLHNYGGPSFLSYIQHKYI